ncbi:LLM class flavin-dependent oxidoreductase [Gryllotalpicola daejeonensis]|uniref:LLM class flavin-dependent oxidoreductase n=1 Tax=Gryllotalpicola daejeonensis TaxID=993087 RepID=A0ABP7ZKN6_9MICO
MSLRRLGFLTIGLFDPERPRNGHESTLQLISLGEELGFDSAWVRQRHLQFGISSPATVLAAATQRTSRIELGTAVIPLGAENPLRLAEDLATVDVLSGGRLNPGFSTGAPIHFDDYKEALYPGTWRDEDLSYARALRLRGFLRGDKVSAFSGREGIEEFSERVEPHAAGLSDRLWYGAGSMRSARWAGANGFNLLTSSVVFPDDGSTDFAAVQRAQIDAYREERGDGARVSQGLVVIPTDSATAAQTEKYRAYVASRAHRVGVPQGPRGMLFAADLVGSSAEIAERLEADAAFQAVDEVAFALPFSFEHDDYVQLLTDIAGSLAPALGWSPTR